MILRLVLVAASESAGLDKWLDLADTEGRLEYPCCNMKYAQMVWEGQVTLEIFVSIILLYNPGRA